MDKCHYEKCDKESISMTVALLQCGRCNTVSYCSKECQRKDYKGHKTQCRETKEVVTPHHVENIIEGHHHDDLIIIYSIYTDIVENDERDTKRAIFANKMIPQWFMFGCVSKNTGVTVKVSATPILCSTFQEMNEIGRAAVDCNDFGFKVRNVYFHKSPTLMSVNGRLPFDEHK